jgi:SET domain-containing protein
MTELSPLAGQKAARIEVRDSPLHGLGVFACVDLPKGSLIERCFYLVIDDDDLHEINRLNDYLFTSPDVKSDYLCVLGCGMIYNHGSPANAEWQIADVDNRFIEFTATADIRAGDEILHDYGKEYWDSRA